MKGRIKVCQLDAPWRIQSIDFGACSLRTMVRNREKNTEKKPFNPSLSHERESEHSEHSGGREQSEHSRACEQSEQGGASKRVSGMSE